MKQNRIKLKASMLCFILFHIGFSQQYDSVVIDEENTDTNNEIYKTGTVFIYDYEITKDEKKYKLKSNKGMFATTEFELVPTQTEAIEVQKIHLIVRPVADEDRTNEHQTEISYFQEPAFASISSTGAIENDQNVWIHPIRRGFFNALETAPFPYIKKPLQMNMEWTDQMKIGEGWGNAMWGTWKGQLLLNYTYKVMGQEILQTPLGPINCFVIESSAQSEIGTTKLISYFSEKYGFVRMEYQLVNALKVALWLTDYKTDQIFNDEMTFFKTKEYIKQ